MLPNGLNESRLGITVTNQVANSPGRRRIKRLIREVFRLNTFDTKGVNVDFVVIARQTEFEHTYQSVLTEISNAIRK